MTIPAAAQHLPSELRALVERLESLSGASHLSSNDIVSILFVVRLGDALHRSCYATFLNLSLVNKLCEKLDIDVPELLEVEVGVSEMRWSIRCGAVRVVHKHELVYDMSAVNYLSKIGHSVLANELTAEEGLQLICDHEDDNSQQALSTCFERQYRDYPGRAGVLVIMAPLCATVFFGGTWWDFFLSFPCGLAAGSLAWLGTKHEELAGVTDYLVSIVVGAIAMIFSSAFPERTCFSAQVFGPLYWFFYGTAFVLSLYETTNNQLVTGVSRFFQAFLRSYGLALGAACGAWIASVVFGVDDAPIDDTCSEKEGQISLSWYILLYPLTAIACLMQFRVKMNQWFICAIVQTVAYKSQYLLGTYYEQPDFVANLVSAYLAVTASAFCIGIENKLHVSTLQLPNNGKSDAESDSGEQYEEERNHLCTSRTDASSSFSPLLSALSNKTGDRDNTGNDENGVHLASQSPESLPSFRLRLRERLTYACRYFNLYGKARAYSENDNSLQAESDLWVALMPALYLLVPGSKLLSEAFTSMVVSFNKFDSSNAGVLGSSLAAIAVAQVVGLRLGFATLWFVKVLSTSHCCGAKKETDRSTDNAKYGSC